MRAPFLTFSGVASYLCTNLKDLATRDGISGKLFRLVFRAQRDNFSRSSIVITVGMLVSYLAHSSQTRRTQAPSVSSSRRGLSLTISAKCLRCFTPICERLSRSSCAPGNPCLTLHLLCNWVRSRSVLSAPGGFVVFHRRLFRLGPRG